MGHVKSFLGISERLFQSNYRSFSFMPYRERDEVNGVGACSTGLSKCLDRFQLLTRGFSDRCRFSQADACLVTNPHRPMTSTRVDGFIFEGRKPVCCTAENDNLPAFWPEVPWMVPQVRTHYVFECQAAHHVLLWHRA